MLTEAREEGRLIQRLPLEQIETGHLVRDRMVFDETTWRRSWPRCAPAASRCRSRSWRARGAATA
jgi:hypothetical protein